MICGQSESLRRVLPFRLSAGCGRLTAGSAASCEDHERRLRRWGGENDQEDYSLRMTDVERQTPGMQR